MSKTGDKLWWLYFVGCNDDGIYTGVCTDVTRRIKEHESGGPRAARYLRGRGPLTLLGAFPVGDRSTALRAEILAKRLPSKAKRRLAKDGIGLEALLEELTD